MHKNIAIIGCGYIGMEAASLWSKKGYHVTTTTRTPERLQDLAAVSQKSQILKEHDEETLALLIAANEILVVMIAADSSDQYESAYLHTAQLMRRLASESKSPRWLIYTSSSSVYGDHQGLWVDETSELLSSTQQGKILIDTEKTYLSLQDFGWHVCILRLAEIYGPGREISQRILSMKGNSLSGSGEQYTNMVHKTDVASALDYALHHHLEGLYNVVDDDHPSRKDLYKQISHQCHLRTIHWDPTHQSTHSGNKRVSNHKIKAAGFTFQFPHRILI